MAQKIEIPQSLKAELPQTAWGKILAATPVVMAVLSTMLAGLASSEMTKAQYDRSFAAQLQAKAGDQWSYYQAKKLRSATAENTLDLLAASVPVHSLDPAALAGQDPATVQALTSVVLPHPASPQLTEAVQSALDALSRNAPEKEIMADLAHVRAQDLNAALLAAEDAARDFDRDIKGINQHVDELDASLMNGDNQTFRNFTFARLRYTEARYDEESKLNYTIANVYELQVRQNNASAENHHRRSSRFFFGMLAAQLAVIIATFAVAARKRNFLWSLAAAAGLAAVSFAVYVFLYV